MIVVYDKITHEIIGHCGTIFDNGKTREATIAELYPGHDPGSLEALYLKDEPRFMVTGAQSYRIALDTNGTVTGLEHVPRIALKCNAKDVDGDGIPDLPADGESTTDVTANLSGKAGVTVTFKATSGKLEARTAKSDEHGLATVKFYASTETVAVHVFASAPGFLDGALTLEFRPMGKVSRTRAERN